MDKQAKRSDCPVSIALDAVGDRWSLVVLRDILLNHKHRFRDLKASDEGIATNILSDRLKKLERHGILQRLEDPDDRRQFTYVATEKGLDLLPLILELGAWGARHGGQTTAPVGAADAYYSNRDHMIESARKAARGVS